MFRRSSVRYGRTPEPETPYQRAAQAWDERIGSARVQAKNWRLMAFGSLVLSMGLAGGSRLAIDPRHHRALGGAGRQARPGAGGRAGDRGLSPSRSADRLVSRPLRREGPLAAGRSDHRAAELAAGLRFHDRPRRAGAQRLCARQRSLRQGRQAADRHRRLERHPRLAVELPRRLGRASLPGRRARRHHPLDRDPHHRDPAAHRRRRLRKNPLGIYVNAINWSKELGQ